MKPKIDKNLSDKVAAIGACCYGLETKDWPSVEYGIAELRRLGSPAADRYEQALKAASGR